MIRYFLGHPTAANLLMAGFLAMGLFSLSRLRRETFPDFAAREVQVRVVYPGASAEEIEQAICVRIEDAVESVHDVEEVRSDAREGVGTVTIEMKEGGDFTAFLAEVQTEVDAIDDFPVLAEDAIVERLGLTDAVVSVAVTGPMSVPHLKAYCEDLKDRLKRDGVSLVEVVGFSDHQFRVELSADRLRGFGLSVAEVADAIARQNVDMPVGVLAGDEREILIRFTDERRTVDDLARLVVIGGELGSELRLGDIATITDRFELEEEKILFDGRRAGVLDVTKTRAEDSLVVLGKVREFVEKERRQAPPGVSLVLTRDVASIVADRLNLLTRNGAQGLVLVFATMALFFRFRFAFWVVMGLPVAFLGALFFLPLIGFSINMITMVGLLLATGLLMDDAIVLSENVAAHLARGKKVVEAVYDGVMEVRVGVFSSFLTTVAVFAPLAFLEGRIGMVLRVMPVVLVLVLAVSLIEAFLILPHHLAHSLRNVDPNRRGRIRAAIDRGLAFVRERMLGPSVDFAVRWRWLTLGIALFLLMISVGQLAGGRLKFRAFPEIDGDVVEARLLLPQGTPLARTEQLVERLLGAAQTMDAEWSPRQPGGSALVRHVQVRYAVNPDAYEAGPHVASVIVDLLPAETRTVTTDGFLSRWRELVGEPADVLSLKYTEPAIGPQGKALQIRFLGADPERLEEAARAAEEWLARYDGVLDLADDLRPGKPEVRVRLRDGATSAGLSAQAVAAQLRAAWAGRVASEIQVRGESLEVDVRLRPADRDRFAALDDFHVTLPGGGQAPLASVADLEQGRGWARLARVDGRPAVTLEGDIDTRRLNTAEVFGAFKTRYLPEHAERFPDVDVAFAGEAEESGKTGASLRRAFAIGLTGVFLLLCFQFRSYLEPLIVMLAIPCALIGVIWGHRLMGLDLSMPSMVGFVSLAGVVVNDSILLVEFIRLRRRDGLDAPAAAAQASRERFRAVLLTSLTTIAGLLPLLAERSLQAQILIPLACSIVFGLLASTVLILVLLPALYAVLNDLGWTRAVHAD